MFYIVFVTISGVVCIVTNRLLLFSSFCHISFPVVVILSYQITCECFSVLRMRSVRYRTKLVITITSASCVQPCMHTHTKQFCYYTSPICQNLLVWRPGLTLDCFDQIVRTHLISIFFNI